MNLQDEMKSALHTFLTSGNKVAIKSLIVEYPDLVTQDIGDYPDCHRITDVCIDNKHYRVCRQISAGEKLTLSEIKESLNELGVPIWLEGEKLKKWAKEEEENPSDEPNDWEMYR